MNIIEIVESAIPNRATATLATSATDKPNKRFNVATVASVAVATSKSEQTEGQRKEAIAKIALSAIKKLDFKCHEKGVVNEILDWPVTDHEHMLEDRALAETATRCVAERYRILRFPISEKPE